MKYINVKVKTAIENEDDVIEVRIKVKLADKVNFDSILGNGMSNITLSGGVS